MPVPPEMVFAEILASPEPFRRWLQGRAPKILNDRYFREFIAEHVDTDLFCLCKCENKDTFSYMPRKNFWKFENKDIIPLHGWAEKIAETEWNLLLVKKYTPSEMIGYLDQIVSNGGGGR